MTHTLKSLLVTTVLALPAAFAAELTQNTGRDPSSQTLSGIIFAPGGLSLEGNVVALCDFASRTSLSWPEAQFVASRLEKLNRPEVAIDVLRSFIGSPANKSFEQFATAEISRTATAEIRRKLSDLNLELVLTEGGRPTVKIDCDATIDNIQKVANELEKLVWPSAYSLEELQEMLEKMLADVLERLAKHPEATIGDIWYAVDKLRLLLVSSFYDATRADYVDKLLGVLKTLERTDCNNTLLGAYFFEYLASRANADINTTALESPRSNKHTGEFVEMLERLGNRADVSPPMVLWAATRLLKLGSMYAEQAKEMLQKLRDDPNATDEDKRWAENKLQNLNAEHFDLDAKAAGVLVELANRADATIWNIRAPIDELKELVKAHSNDPDYAGQFAKMLEKLAKHLGVEIEDIRVATDELEELVKTHPAHADKYAEVLVLLGKHPEATYSEIEVVALKLKSLTPANPEQAGKFAEVFELYGKHHAATPCEIQEAAEAFEKLVNIYPAHADKYAEMLERLAKKFVETCGELSSQNYGSYAVRKLDELVKAHSNNPDYADKLVEASVLYAKYAGRTDCSVIVVAAERLKKLAAAPFNKRAAYNQKRAELLVFYAGHPKITLQEIKDTIEVLDVLGSNHADKLVEVRILYAKHRDAPFHVIEDVAIKLGGLRPVNSEQAGKFAEVFERCGKHPERDGEYISDMCRYLRKLGEFYPGRRDEFNAKANEIVELIKLPKRN